MPSAVLVDPPPATPSDDEGVTSVAVPSAYLTPLLSKHARGLPLYLEDLVRSYDAAIAALTTRNTSGNEDTRTELESLHRSQLAAYESAARAALAESAEAMSYPSVEAMEAVEAYISRIIAHIKTHHIQLYAGWKVKEDVVDGVFWSPIRKGAQKSYLENAKDKEKDTVGTVRDYEAAALGALLSKSEEHNKVNGQEGAMCDDDEAGGSDEEDEDEVVLVAEEGEEEEDAVEDKPGEKTTEQEPVKTPVPIHGKKRRRLPGGPLGGDASQQQSTAAAKKQKTAVKVAAAGGGSGRGSTTANGPGGRGGKSGRGGRGRRNRKKGAG
mmetsp:Transcript_10722/g.25291  ORF Transcript_10722/g.25291 Transcript_10722/m.25291 type:complete len:325 (-) Transcript_10722:842-1816(-)